MSQYHPPLKDIASLLGEVFDFDQHARRCGIDCDTGTVLAVAEKAGTFANELIDPSNVGSDRNGVRWRNSTVTTSRR